MEADSRTAQAVQLGIDNGVWQTEFGYAVFQHAANFVQSLEYVHLKAAFCHIACKRQSGRS